MMWERLLMGVMNEATIKANALKSPYSSAPYVIDYTGKDGDAYACDYGDYYNVHGLSFGVGGNSYMYGSWDHCGYHYSTMSGVIESLPTNAGSHWGPGHEIGHQHQGPLNMRGLTEVTNNLFSNVVLWYYGESTSRYNGDEGALSNVLKAFNTQGSDFFTNNIWAQTHMYYKLFLYYHVLGKNPKFYPVLFEMLRQDPMTIEYEQSGVKSLLHFYKKCCLASGEDLTEFFRAHGFFRVMKDRFVGDYSDANYNMTQEEIDAAIAEVKALKYPENIAVLFINDATGETIESHKGDDLVFYGESKVCADLGSYASFATAAVPEYTYSLSGLSITMEGTGGIGFAIYNENNEILAFSDKKSFSVSADALLQLTTGQARVVAMQANSTSVICQNILENASTEQLRTELASLLGSAEAVLNLRDATGTKVGYYHSAYMTSLEEAYNTAKYAYDSSNEASYLSAYNGLLQEYSAFLVNTDAKIALNSDRAYILINKAYKDRLMNIDDEHKVKANTDAHGNAYIWNFEPSDTDGKYYVRNAATSTYVGNISSGSQLYASATSTSDATAYELRDMGNGYMALVAGQGMHCSSSQDYIIVGWGADSEATQWTIVDVQAHVELHKLAAKTGALIETMAEDITVAGDSKVGLTAENYYSNAPYTAQNNSDKFTSYSVLCDGKPSTYFHSDYNESTAPNENHYIRMDMGQGNALQNFKLDYRTRESGYVCAPTSIAIDGSNSDANDASSMVWNTIATISSGLPTENNKAYTSTSLTSGVPYRYIRMRVLGANGGKVKGYPYFVLSELGLSKVDYTAQLKEEYTSIDKSLVIDAYKAKLGAETLSLTENAQEALTHLQAKYDALLNAKKSIYKEQLNALIEEHVKTGLGYPKQTSAEYIALLEATTVEEFNAALPAYKSCDDIEVPQPGTFLRIKAIDGWNDDAPYLGSKNSSGNSRAEYVAEADASTIFYFDGAQLVSYGSGNYLVDNNNFLGYNGVKPSGAKFTFHAAANDKFGACNISFKEGGRWLYVNQNNYTDAGNGTPTADGYCFNLEKVTSIPFTFKAAAFGYATFNAPVAVQLPEGVKAYVSEILEGKKLKMTELASGVVPANTAVLLWNESVANEDVTVNLTIVENTTFEGTNSFVGTVAAENLKAEKDCYSLQKGTKGKVGFYEKSTGTKGGFKAWIEMAKTGEARAFTIIFDGEDATGIKEALGLENENVEIYDLSGRRLDKPAKGVNIIGGKTVIVR